MNDDFLADNLVVYVKKRDWYEFHNKYDYG